jgi:hypothetical protein
VTQMLRAVGVGPRDADKNLIGHALIVSSPSGEDCSTVETIGVSGSNQLLSKGAGDTQSIYD